MKDSKRNSGKVQASPLPAELAPGAAMTKLEFHPVASVFPLMNGPDFDDLVADIREHGLLEAIWLHRDGRIIDGRNRYRACSEAKVQFKTRPYTGPDEDLLGFVVSMNFHRRHLNKSQRAMVGARMVTLQQGQRADFADEGTIGLSSASKIVRVNERSIKRATVVLDHGSSAIIEACDQGTVKVSDAVRVVHLPAAEQDRIIERVTTGLNKTLAGAHRAIDIQRQKRAIAEGTAKMPEGVFEVIVVDPPWPGSDLPYPPMSLDIDGAVCPGQRADFADEGTIGLSSASKIVRVNERSIKRATVVLDHGSSAIIEACDQGTVKVSDAVRVVHLPAAEQDRIIERVTTGLNKTLAGAHRAIDIQRQKRAIAEGTAKMPEGVFEVIVVDPPLAGQRPSLSANVVGGNCGA